MSLYYVVATPAFSGLSGMSALGRKVVAGEEDITGSFSIVYSSTYNRYTQETIATTTLTNISSSTIIGPIHFVISNISTTAVWSNSDGVDSEGHKFKDLTGLMQNNELLPSESLSPFDIIFYDPTRERFTFDQKVFQG